MQHTAYSMQYTAYSMQHAAYSIQHAAYSMQHTACSIQHTACSIQHTAYTQSSFKQPTRRTNYPNLFCYKILHVSGIFSAHHQEFSAVNSALVSFMQVYDDRFQASQDGIHPESAWKPHHRTNHNDVF